MPHITLSIPKNVYDTMKNHPEIKWSEIARQSITAYASQIEGEMTMEEFRAILGPKLIKSIRAIPEEKAKKLYKKVKESKWRRQQLLTQARLSKAKED